MADAQREPAQPTTSGNERNKGRANRNKYRYNATGRDFKGATPKIGGVLCAPSETHVSEKVSYSKFKDLLNNYIVKHMRNAKEIIGSLENGADPVDEFEGGVEPSMAGSRVTGRLATVGKIDEGRESLARRCALAEES